jgi:hypothetical protein
MREQVLCDSRDRDLCRCERICCETSSSGSSYHIRVTTRERVEENMKVVKMEEGNLEALHRIGNSGHGVMGERYPEMFQK